MKLEMALKPRRPQRELTPEEEEELDKACDIYHEYGEVCISHENGAIHVIEPKEAKKHSFMEDIKNDPICITDYHGSAPFNELRRRALNGEQNEK